MNLNRVSEYEDCAHFNEVSRETGIWYMGVAITLQFFGFHLDHMTQSILPILKHPVSGAFQFADL